MLIMAERALLPRRLLDGYAVFKSTSLAEDSERYRVLSTAGQRPETLLIGCCDSRAAPETIFNAHAGELFVIRNVSALVPPCEDAGHLHFHGTSAGIEYAVTHLKVRNIVVLGHGRCGGIDGYLTTRGEGSMFLRQWLSILEPAHLELRRERMLEAREHAETSVANFERISLEVDAESEGGASLLASVMSAISRAEMAVENANVIGTHSTFVLRVTKGWPQVENIRADVCAIKGVKAVSVLLLEHEEKPLRQQAMELKAIEFSLSNLRSFPFIKELESIGEISLHGAWFDISCGRMLGFDEKAKEWCEI